MNVHPSVSKAVEPVILSEISLAGKSSEELQALFKRVFNIAEEKPLHTLRIDGSYERESYEETALFFYPRVSKVARDRQGAMNFSLKDRRIERILTIAKRQNVVIRLVNSLEEINATLKERRNISYIEMGFCGDRNKITVGDGAGGTTSVMNANTVYSLSDKNIKKGAVVVIASSKAGFNDMYGASIAAFLSDALKGKEVTVIAPDHNINGNSMFLEEREGAPFPFRPYFMLNGFEATKSFYKGIDCDYLISFDSDDLLSLEEANEQHPKYLGSRSCF